MSVMTKNQQRYLDEIDKGVVGDSHKDVAIRIIGEIDAYNKAGIPDPETTIPAMVEALKNTRYFLLDIEEKDHIPTSFTVCAIDKILATLNDESEVGE